MKTTELRTAVPTLVDQTEEAILRHCAEAGLSAGDPIPNEQTFVEILQVSRTVVREAFSRLRGIGLIENRKRRGPILLRPPLFPGLDRIVNKTLIGDQRERELLEMRIMLELGMAEFIYRRQTPAHLAELEAIAQREDAGNLTREQELAISIDFHSCLYRIVGNSALDEFMDVLRMFFDIVAKHDLDAIRLPNVPTHRDVLTALRGPSPAVFRDTMRDHLGEYWPLLQPTD